MIFFFLLCVSFSFGVEAPVVEVFCGLGYYAKNEVDPPDFSGATPFTKCVEKNDTIPEEECTPTFTSGMYKDLNVSFNWGGVQWKDGKCVANTCPTINANFKTVPEDKLSDGNLFKICNKLGCVTSFKGRKCDKMKLVTFIIIISVSVVAFIIVCIILCCICCCCCCRKKQPAEVVPFAAGAEKGVPVEMGACVIITLAKQERETKRVMKLGNDMIWAETLEFVGLGAEDDDASFQLKNDADLVGTANLRLVDYVNKKTSVTVVLKNSAGAETGSLDIDVEMVVDETAEVPTIKAVFAILKGTVGRPNVEPVQVLEQEQTAF